MTLVISNVRSTRGVFAYSVSCVFGQEYFLKNIVIHMGYNIYQDMDHAYWLTHCHMDQPVFLNWSWTCDAH